MVFGSTGLFFNARNYMYTAVIVVCCAPSSLLSEITDVIGDRKEVTADDLDKLKYTEQVCCVITMATQTDQYL